MASPDAALETIPNASENATEGEKLTGFLKCESAIRRIALTLYPGRWQSRARVKSVGRLHPELHLTLLAQGQL